MLSQKDIFFQVLVIVIISSCFIIREINGQEETEAPPEDTEWPVVIDPFPESDDIGPEPEPTSAPPPDCTSACQESIAQANGRIDELQNQLTEVNATLLARIVALEAGSSGGGSGNNEMLLQRITELENFIAGNTTNIMSKIDTDVGALRTQFTTDVSALRKELEDKIAAIPSGGGGGSKSAEAAEVYNNLTLRITTIEKGKLRTLLIDNDLWRKNFRVINATFAKLRKSGNGNNVVLTG